MTKEVTKTTVKLAKMEMENGLPQAVLLPDEVMIGNVSLEKAQKEVGKKYDHPVTVLGVEVETLVYEMPVEEFIQLASVKVSE
jgi:hypothetical protein